MVSDPVTVRSSTLCAILEAAHLGNSLQIVGLRGSRVRSDGHEETGKTIGASLAAIGGETLEQIIATAMVLFLIVSPFFGLLALGAVMGIKTLFRLFFVERRAFERLGTPA